MVAVALILFLMIMYMKMKTPVYESFTNQTLEIQTGVGPIAPSGTIKFDKPFSNMPLIFTQVNGNTASSQDSFSVQIFNVSTAGFDYTKQKIYNDSNGQFSVTKLVPSTVETFNWIAI